MHTTSDIDTVLDRRQTIENEHTGRVGGADCHRLGRHRWFTAPEAVAYGLADEVIGDPDGAPESGTPA